MDDDPIFCLQFKRNIMTKEEFIISLEKATKDFSHFWDEGNSMYTSKFPPEMGLSDWFEQFTMYAEDKLKES